MKTPPKSQITASMVTSPFSLYDKSRDSGEREPGATSMSSSCQEARPQQGRISPSAGSTAWPRSFRTFPCSSMLISARRRSSPSFDCTSVHRPTILPATARSLRLCSSRCGGVIQTERARHVSLPAGRRPADIGTVGGLLGANPDGMSLEDQVSTLRLRGRLDYLKAVQARRDGVRAEMAPYTWSINTSAGRTSTDTQHRPTCACAILTCRKRQMSSR